MPTICCDELAYAVTVKAVQDKNIGTVIRVTDPDDGGQRFMPIKHCPWCSTEIPQNSPMSPVILYGPRTCG